MSISSVVEISPNYQLHGVEYPDEKTTSNSLIKKVIRWFPTIEHVNHAIHLLESSTMTRYNVLYKRMGRGRVSFNIDDGIPYITERITKLECQHGRDRNKSYNEKRKMKKAPANKKYVRVQPSYKADCPAYIDIFEVSKYPQYKAISLKKNHRDAASQALRVALESDNKDIVKVSACKVAFPPPYAHQGHVLGQVNEHGNGRTLDPRIIAKIDQLVEAGMVSMKDIQKHLRKFVYEEIFKNQVAPSKSHKRFFPTKKVICDYYIQSCIRQNKVNADGENLTFLIKDWDSSMKTDNVFQQYASNASDLNAEATKRSIVLGDNRKPLWHNKEIQDESEEIISDLIEAYIKYSPPKDGETLQRPPLCATKPVTERVFEILDKIKELAHCTDIEEELLNTESSLQIILDSLIRVSNLHKSNDCSRKRKSSDADLDHSVKKQRSTINVTIVSSPNAEMDNEDFLGNMDFSHSPNINTLLPSTDSLLPCVEVITDDPIEDVILTNGPHQLTANDLHLFKSMSTKNFDCLTMGNMVNSFLWQLALNSSEVMYAENAVLQNINNGSVAKELWDNMSLEGKKYLFLPWNHYQNDWALLIVDIVKQTLLCIDPLCHIATKTTLLQKAFSFLQKILFLKLHFNLKSTDSSSEFDQIVPWNVDTSAVFICIVAKSLTFDESLSSLPTSTEKCREEILKIVVGHCLDELPNKGMCKVCKECNQSGAGWIQCARCAQWFHVICVGLTFDQAENGIYFICPPFDSPT
uniref:Uncharacterized protein LOC100179154 n=1 Tax=Phallusia mammillata TaxID=59560 RepID=A0A6F9DHH9_9ASCI|nr:uncharacterized protein LOC100179154 [Phallusia mammillata]